MLVQQYMKDPQSVDGTLARAVVAVAARHGDAELYNQFKAQLQNAKSPEQYYRYFYALGEFPQPALIQQTLDSTLTPEVRGQDLYMLPRMMDNPAAEDHVGLHAAALRRTEQENRRRPGRRSASSSMRPRASAISKRRSRCSSSSKQHPFPGTERNQKEALEGHRQLRLACGSQQQSNLAAWLKQNAPANALIEKGNVSFASVR